MGRPEVGYQSEDVATVAAWLDDATLETDLLAITGGWRGFSDALEHLDTTSPVAPSPAVPPAALGYAADPVATASWRLGYTTDLSERKPLAGGLLDGLPAILNLTLAVQPFVALATVLSLDKKIRESIAAQARAAGLPANASISTVKTSAPRGTTATDWSWWSVDIRFWS